MAGRAVYELLYRIGAARWKRGWDTGAGPEVVQLAEDGTLSPAALGGNRVIDLGCGTGANVIYLAARGFEGIGVDFSRVAVAQARRRAEALGLSERATFLVGDVTKPVRGIEGPFDLILLYNVLQDLDAIGRRRLAAVTRELSRPGTKVLLWCWYGGRSELPLISYRGPSRLAPFVVEPGEERDLFEGFDSERPDPQPGQGRAAFLLTRN
jgi:SAM-dependent methyltransferase